MSATIDTITAAPDRGAAATRKLCDILALGSLKPKDLKQLSVAVAEAAAAETARNPAFREHVLSIYHELTARPASSTSRSGQRKSKASKPQPVPIRQVDPTLLGPDKPLDPYLIQYAYGDDQLRLVIDRFPATELKKAAAIVEQRNPGTKPTSRSQKAALVDYIVEHVTKPA